MRKILICLVLSSFVSTAALAGDETYRFAQQPTRMPCHKANEIAKVLREKHNELPVAYGLQTGGNLLQVYATEDGSTWTIVVTRPDGMACVVSVGEGWETRPLTSRDPVA